MNNLDNILKERGVPDLLTSQSGERITDAQGFEKRRAELRRIIQEDVYGFLPPKPDHVDVTVETVEERFARGFAPETRLTFTCTVGERKASFKVSAVVPKSDVPVPAFVMLNFGGEIPHKYLPSEEIADRGFAVFSFNYKDVASDDGKFSNGIAPLFTRGRRGKSAPSKIAIWAWAAMRVMDHIETLPEIDKSAVAVIGHSRLGKTALFTGALDKRFRFVISNDSGCMGAAISRGKVGESVTRITSVYPFWFCPKFVSGASRFEELGYDQSFLLALTAPRHLLVGSADEDEWADPASEFLGLYDVNRVYALYGKRGLVTPDEIPEAKTVLSEGDSCYHIRRGKHYLSREDWAVYMDYIDRVIGRK